MEKQPPTGYDKKRYTAALFPVNCVMGRRTGGFMYKILIVEDDDTITAVLTRTFLKWNYEVQAVVDFGRVGEQFAQFSPDLVLLDISLPFFDGYYWCQEIRKTSQVPIIFISSAADDMNLVMAVNMGADDFLAKPFRLEVVLAKIQALLAQGVYLRHAKGRNPCRGSHTFLKRRHACL